MLVYFPDLYKFMTGFVYRLNRLNDFQKVPKENFEQISLMDIT